MQEYTFKSAALRRARTWAVHEGQLMRRGGEKALKLSDVTKAVWGDMAYRGTRNAWLYLTGPDGVTKIGCSDSGGSEDRETFLRLCKAICEALDQTNPNLDIRQGGGAALKWSMFLIGAVGALGGLAFLLAGLTGNVRQGEVTAVLLGSFMAAGLGYMAWSYAPWRPDLALKPRDMALLLGGMTAPMDGPDYDA